MQRFLAFVIGLTLFFGALSINAIEPTAHFTNINDLNLKCKLYANSPDQVATFSPTTRTFPFSFECNYVPALAGLTWYFTPRLADDRPNVVPVDLNLFTPVEAVMEIIGNDYSQQYYSLDQDVQIDEAKIRYQMQPVPDDKPQFADATLAMHSTIKLTTDHDYTKWREYGYNFCIYSVAYNASGDIVFTEQWAFEWAEASVRTVQLNPSSPTDVVWYQNKHHFAYRLVFSFFGTNTQSPNFAIHALDVTREYTGNHVAFVATGPNPSCSITNLATNETRQVAVTIEETDRYVTIHWPLKDITRDDGYSVNCGSSFKLLTLAEGSLKTIHPDITIALSTHYGIHRSVWDTVYMPIA